MVNIRSTHTRLKETIALSIKMEDDPVDHMLNLSPPNFDLKQPDSNPTTRSMMETCATNRPLTKCCCYYDLKLGKGNI